MPIDALSVKGVHSGTWEATRAAQTRPRNVVLDNKVKGCVGWSGKSPKSQHHDICHNYLCNGRSLGFSTKAGMFNTGLQDTCLS